MSTMIKYLRLIKRYIRLSTIDLIQFPVEVFNKILSLIFDILFVCTFWISISKVGISYSNWNSYELFILSGCGIISNSIAQLTFGFRDLEYLVIRGELDKFLMRPINLTFSLMAEKLFIFWVIAQLILGGSMIFISQRIGDITLVNIIPAIIVLVLGTFTFQFIYGSVSLFCFWVGKISSIRDIIFSFKTAKDYPMDIFGNLALKIFTYILPLSLLTTFPAKILLGKESNYILILGIALILFILWIVIYNIIFKRALQNYQSTGS